ncbi:conserved hypothetical protein [Klebsiella pneumoniae]|nr:hypothetical protein [Klebsiella pneumoniae]SBN16428.1 conserved hypothetical protein [Klebsiella pneumoniae]
MSPLRTERHTRFPGAKAGGQIGKLGASFSMQVNGCAGSAAGSQSDRYGNHFCSNRLHY